MQRNEARQDCLELVKRCALTPQPVNFIGKTRNQFCIKVRVDRIEPGNHPSIKGRKTSSVQVVDRKYRSNATSALKLGQKRDQCSRRKFATAMASVQSRSMSVKSALPCHGLPHAC